MQRNANDFSFKDLFVPLTTKKVIIFIIIIGLITFFNSLFNNFVGDDYGQVVYNSAIQSIWNIPIFFRTSTFALGNGISGIYYKPLLLITYTIIYALFGPNALAFHFPQFILFVANAILLFLLLKKFIHIQLSFLLSVIFLVHPINQAVAGYIADLQDTLFFFFGLLALLFSMSEKIKHSQIIVFSLLLLSVLSKETGVAFILINLFYIAFFKKQQLIRTLIISVLLLVCYWIAHFYAVGTQFTASNFSDISRLSLQIRVLNIPEIILFYLQTFLFPINLSVNYNWVISNITFLNFYLPLLIDILFFSSLIIAAKKIRIRKSGLFLPFVFFIFWFIIGLGFHLQIIPLDATVATSWFYLPLAGLLGIIGILIQVYIPSKLPKTVLHYFLTFTILIFTLLTIIRNSNFTDNLTLTCHDANVTPSYSLENSCGNSLAVAGSYTQAQKHLELSVKYAPYYYANWFSLGTVLGIEGAQTHNMLLIKKGENDIHLSIQMEPNLPTYYESLGYLYLNYNDPTTTIPFLSNAVQKFPNDYKLWLYLSIVEYKVGNRNSAVHMIKTSYNLNPLNPDVVFEYNKIVHHSNSN